MENSDYGGTRSNAQNAGGNKKLQQTQAQVDEVVGIMRNNVAKVLERDEKLSELDQRADNLQIGASQFEQQAARLKRKYWWKNLKMMIIIGVIVAIVLIVIIVSATTGTESSDSAPANAAVAAVTPASVPSIAPAS